MKTSLAIIPARGGSKRIPRKNIKLFNGQPIIAYSILSTIKSMLFDEVMVSTDDEDIKLIAESYGAKVPFFRSAKNANDFATTADVVEEVIAYYSKQGITFEHIAIIYPTAPFITALILKQAWEQYISSGASSLVSIVKYSFPIQRSLTIEQNKVKFNWPEHISTRSQDLPPTYHDAGQFYFVNTQQFLTHKSVFLEHTIGFELPETKVQDIDTISDWQIAELKFKLLTNE
ncbi:MAG: pseudaminic acid cytidylyltransferase [Bacteroidia bacterium]|jgi:N-acylneuraminate cytidylyltransferase|nr:pseudaminic acid cytidylyltransferase [Bacteroidia bacterium]